MDSTIVLAWVGSHASRLKTFVPNRVAKIQTLSSATQWNHISGRANPADLATLAEGLPVATQFFRVLPTDALSRGCDAKTLAAFELWWSEPEPTTQIAVEIPIISADQLYSTELKTVS
ncbi:hypothetical protein TNCV_880771 [Trichonephila clavipes]|nr:hypothetical protein TNCV_880771 [Trichonephila clavipes]